MNFGEALEAIKNGKKAKRKGWNGKEQYVVLAICRNVSQRLVWQLVSQSMSTLEVSF